MFAYTDFLFFYTIVTLKPQIRTKQPGLTNRFVITEKKSLQLHSKNQKHDGDTDVVFLFLCILLIA